MCVTALNADLLIYLKEAVTLTQLGKLQSATFSGLSRIARPDIEI